MKNRIYLITGAILASVVLVLMGAVPSQTDFSTTYFRTNALPISLVGNLTNWSKLATNAVVPNTAAGVTNAMGIFDGDTAKFLNGAGALATPAGGDTILTNDAGIVSMVPSNVFRVNLSDSSLTLGRFTRPGYPSTGQIYHKSDVATGDGNFGDIFFEQFEDESDPLALKTYFDLGRSVDPGFPGIFLQFAMYTNGVAHTANISADSGRLNIQLTRASTTLTRLSPSGHDYLFNTSDVTPYLLDTDQDIASGNILEVGNHSTNKFTVSWNGAVTATSYTAGATNVIGGLAAKAPLVSPSFTTPTLGVATATSLTMGSTNVTGALAGKANSATTLSGYGITDAAPIANPTFTGTVTAPSLTITTGLSTPLLQTSSLTFSNALKGNQVTLAYDAFGTNMVLDLSAGNQFFATLTTHTKFYITNTPTLGTTNYQPITLHVWENGTGGYRALWGANDFDFRSYSSELNRTNASARNTLNFEVGAALTNLVFVSPEAPKVPWPTGGTNSAGTAVQFPLGSRLNMTVGTLALGAGRLHAIPFFSEAGGLVTNLALWVTSGASAGGVARVGIYDNASLTAPYPGNLVVDGGEQATTSSAAAVNFPVSARLLPNRIYFAAIFIGVANPTVHNFNGITQDRVWGYPIGSSNPYTYLYSTIAYGTMPTTFGTTSLTWISNGTGAPVVWAQFSSSP